MITTIHMTSLNIIPIFIYNIVYQIQFVARIIVIA